MGSCRHYLEFPYCGLAPLPRHGSPVPPLMGDCRASPGRNYEDVYSDPGSPLTRRTAWGTYVLAKVDGQRQLLLEVDGQEDHNAGRGKGGRDSGSQNLKLTSNRLCQCRSPHVFLTTKDAAEAV